MNHLRAYVTDLDQLMWYRRIEDMTLDEICSRLRHESTPNRAMEMGTAWHSVLENPPSDEIEVVKQDGFVFMVETDAEIELPQVREIRTEKTYAVDGVLLTLSGRVDGITGNKITDHKLTARPDPEGYQNSYQWKAYLDMFEADQFEYILYHGTERDSVVTIRDISPFRMYRYPGMADDLLAGIRDYVGFVRRWLPELFTEAA